MRNPNEPRSIHPETVRTFAGDDAGAELAPRYQPLRYVFAGLAFAILLIVAVPALMSLAAGSPASSSPAEAAPAPTAAIVTPAEAAPAEAAPAQLPPVDGNSTAVFTVTMPAGAAPDDFSMTVYAGWRWQDSGVRSGDSCMLFVWDEQLNPDQLWLRCSLVGLGG